ncbi:hypothetical protein OF83DRAFT_49682 [Amylostereum chailletii]|nr:hypothetical protein OF83DRAFT_49682 [Amylostereum chailletii]
MRIATEIINEIAGALPRGTNLTPGSYSGNSHHLRFADVKLSPLQTYPPMILNTFVTSPSTALVHRDDQDGEGGGFQRSTGIAIGVVLGMPVATHDNPLFILIVAGFFLVGYYRTSNRTPSPQPPTSIPTTSERRKKKRGVKSGTRPLGTPSNAPPFLSPLGPAKVTAVPGGDRRNRTGGDSSVDDSMESLVLPDLPSPPSPCLASVRPSKW